MTYSCLIIAARYILKGKTQMRGNRCTNLPVRENIYSSSHWEVDIAITDNTTDDSSNKLKPCTVIASLRDDLPRKEKKHWN